MNRFLCLLVGGLLACDPMPPSGDVFAPVEAQAAVVSAVPAVDEDTPQGDFDFDAEDRQEEVLDAVTASDLDPVEMQARVFGVDPDSVSAPVPSAPAAPEAPPAPGTELPSPQWISDTPVGGSWGVRLLATVHDVQPPRAMVALPDGTEIVVQPGQMLPEHHLVVLAVGRDAVQLARITPQGFYARVETETVGSMFPSGAGVE